MITMTSEELKKLLIDGITFNDSITLIDDLKFYGENDSKITYLPDNLSTNELWMQYSNITILPNNLSVKELWIRYSKLTILPEDLSVEIMYLIESEIRYIPSTIKNLKEICVDKYFLLSIPYDSFLNCLTMFKDIIKVIDNSEEFTAQQFEQRLAFGR